jgi:amidohydrolase
MFREACQQIEKEMIAWRRDFHQHPELSFHESRTAKVISNFLRQYGLEVREAVHGYGVMGDLKGPTPGPVIAFRADMDALPIQEETGLAFASKVPGVMHACGHDGHMAALMGAAQVLSSMREHIKGTIRFIFQPAEELTPGGALGLIEAGVLEGVDAIFGVHLWSELPTGTFYTTLGPMMAASDKFKIEISGQGGHGAMPHKTVDTLLVASHLVMAAQHIVSRQVNPIESGVLSFGVSRSGTAFNVIPDKAELEGTARSFSPEVRDLLQHRLEETAKSIGGLYGAKIEIQYERGYPAVINHEKEARISLEEAEKVFGRNQIGFMPPNMAGEDFSYYLQKIPGAFCFIGAEDPSQSVYPHHHPRFQIDEKSITLAADWFCHIAARYVF